MEGIRTNGLKIQQQEHGGVAEAVLSIAQGRPELDVNVALTTQVEVLQAKHLHVDVQVQARQARQTTVPSMERRSLQPREFLEQMQTVQMGCYSKLQAQRMLALCQRTSGIERMMKDRLH